MINNIHSVLWRLVMAAIFMTGTMLWAGSALAEEGSAQQAAAASETPVESALLSAQYKCPDCQTKQKNAQQVKDWLAQLKKKLKEKQSRLNQNQQEQTTLDGEIKALKQQIKDQEGVGASSTDTLTGVTTRAYDDGKGWVVVTTQEPGQEPQFQRRYKRASTREIEQDIAKKKAEKQRLQKEATTLKGEIQRLEADVLKAEADFNNQLAALANCKDQCDLEVAESSGVGEGLQTDGGSKAGEVVVDTGVALDTAGRELILEGTPIDLTPAGDPTVLAPVEQDVEPVKNGADQLPVTQQNPSLDQGQAESQVLQGDTLPDGAGQTKTGAVDDVGESAAADIPAGGAAVTSSNLDASDGEISTSRTTPRRRDTSGQFPLIDLDGTYYGPMNNFSVPEGYMDFSENLEDSARRLAERFDSTETPGSATDNGLEYGYRFNFIEPKEGSTPPGEAFEPRYKLGYTFDSKFRLDLNARYHWNDEDHRDSLAVGDGLGSGLSAEKVARSKSSDDPVHISVYPSISLDYKFSNSISLGLVGGYAQDPPSTNGQDAPAWESQPPEMDDAATPPSDLAPMNAVRRYIGLRAFGATMAGISPIMAGQFVLLETGSPVIAAIVMATLYDFYTSAFVLFPQNPNSMFTVLNRVNMLRTIWAFLFYHRAAYGITATQAGLAMAEAVLVMGGTIEQAVLVTAQALKVWPGVTRLDIANIALYLSYMRIGFTLLPTAPVLAFRPPKTLSYMPLLDPFMLAPMIIYAEMIRWFLDDPQPNDPLYMKKGGIRKAGRAVKKGLGFLLGAIGASAGTEEKGASDQYGLHSVGFTPTDQPGSAWAVYDGSQKNVVVAVIDSGLDAGHADSPQHQWTNADEIPGNGIDDDANGYVDDIHGWNFIAENNDLTDDFGHGTFVAGIIAAKRNNGEGIAGINPGAQIMTLKVLNKEGSTKSLPVYRAIRYAVDNGARIINLSLGGRGISPLEQFGINFAYAMGCVVVVAAGNSSADVADYGPPGSRRVISVAALNMDGKPRGSSNRGLNVALTAPGESIYSLTAKKGARDGKFMPIMVGKYFRSSGTSFSAPFVAGTASLMWAHNPDLTNRQIEDMILQSTKDVHDKGWDPKTGFGLLNAYGAMTQQPDELLVPRITEVFVNQHKRKIASVDLYGVIRGNLDNYSVFVGRGKKPKKWEMVHGPDSKPLEHQLISRIEGKYFARGSLWTVRLDAMDRQQRLKRIEIQVVKEKTEW